MLVTAIAYDQEKDLGRAYDRIMERLADEDWACFLDHDAMFTTRRWYAQLVKAIEARPNAGAFTAVTNRIGCRYQLADVSQKNHDVLYHRKQGQRLLRRHGTRLVDVTDEEPLSGVVICIAKKVWKKIGGFASGFFGVDNQLHWDLRRAGYRIYLLPGLYVYHFYRGDGDRTFYRGVKTATQIKQGRPHVPKAK